MQKLSLILVALVILFCPLNAKAQADFPDIDAFLKATLKNEDQLSVQAKGDLNGDGLEDWVGVIHGQKPDSRPTYQLYVLLRVPQGGYHLAEKSKEEEISGMGCCWLEGLRISRASIFVQNNAKDAATMEATTHQFKLYQGEWRLIGVMIYYDDHTPGARSTKDTDMNLLTGTVIEKKQRGSRKPIIKRRQKKFATYLLKDFDFFNGFGTEMF
jgi:hypothetical protein